MTKNSVPDGPRVASGTSRWHLAMRAAGVLLAATVVTAIALVGTRWWMLRQLTTSIATADDQAAARLVAELARLETPAYPALAAAANAPRSAVALSARAEIDRRVAQWQREAFLEPASFPLRDRAVPLAEAIEAELPRMSADGRRWAAEVTRQLLALAQRQALPDRLALVRVCDRVLAALPPEEPPPELEGEADYRLTLAPPAADAFPQTDVVEAGDPTWGWQPAESFPAAGTTPATSDPQPGDSAASTTLEPVPGLMPEEPPAEQSTVRFKSAGSAADNAGATSQRVPAFSASTSRRSASATPTDPSPPERTDADAPDEVDVSDAQQLGEPDDRRLFALLASGTKDQQDHAAEQLRDRGYGRSTPREARMMTSTSTSDRRALVDMVLTSKRLEPRKWLWHLAHDPAGDVRAAAIASISTSGDRQLIADALELALRDTDPRVAEQAAALRQRLK